jgi:hypothetical protein
VRENGIAGINHELGGQKKKKTSSDGRYLIELLPNGYGSIFAKQVKMLLDCKLP